jgi:hypothetical protein
MITNDRLDFIARAALGTGIGATLAVLVSTMNSAFAATVGLVDSDPIAIKLALLSIAIWVMCRVFHVRS